MSAADLFTADTTMSAPEEAIGCLSVGEGDGDTTSDESAKQFPFFELPRELRNKVYAEITTDLWIPVDLPVGEGWDRLPYWVRPEVPIEVPSALLESAPDPRMRLVSRQFEEEYGDEMAMPSDEARLTVPVSDIENLLSRGGKLKGFGRSLARVRHYNKIRKVSPWHGRTQQWKDMEQLERLLPLMSSVKRLEFVRFGRIGTLSTLCDDSRAEYYPPDFKPPTIRRLFSDHRGHSLPADLEISCSISLVGALFSMRGDEGFEDNAMNRIVYHCPASMQPSGEKYGLRIDATEAYQFEDVEEDMRSIRAPHKSGSKPKFAWVWEAGYRMKYVRCEDDGQNLYP